MTRVRVLLIVAGLALCLLCLTVPMAAAVASAMVVVALAPIGRTVVGRVGAVLLVWMTASQFAYSFSWPTSFPPRQAIGWSIAGIVVLGWRTIRWPGARQAVGRIGLPEVALLAFTSITVWWFSPWRGDATHVLDRMLLGWDSSGHFGMVEQLRFPQAAGAAMFPSYPRGFHALVASLMELGGGHPGGLDAELVAYTYASTAVIGMSLVMLAAYVLDAPVFRRAPVLLVPAVSALVTLFLQLEDAAQVPYYGFGNFLEAAAFAGAGILLTVRWSRREDSWRWFLLGCAAAGIIGTWPPLLAFLAPVPVAAWLSRRRFQHDTLRRLAYRAVISLAVVLVAVFVQPRVSQVLASSAPASATPVSPLVALDRFLLLDGAIATSALGWPVVFPLAGILVPLGLVMYGRRSPSGLRVAYLWVPSALALGMAITMLAYEVVRVGSPRYYGIKVLCATTLAAGSVAVVACTYVLEEVLRRPRPRVTVGTAVALLSAVLLVCDGGPVALGPLPASPGGGVRAVIASDQPEKRKGLSDAIRSACSAVAGKPGEYYLLVPGATHDDLVRANSWIITCGLDWWSPDHSTALRELLPDKAADGLTVVDLAVDTRRILQARPRSRVVVAEAVAATATANLTTAEKDRLVTY